MVIPIRSRRQSFSIKEGGGYIEGYEEGIIGQRGARQYLRRNVDEKVLH